MRRYLLVSSISLITVAIVYFLPYGTWAEINSLPAHPLIVHGVVVILPIVAVLLFFGVFKKSWLKQFHVYLIVALTISTVGVLAAKSSGDSLTAAVGLPEFHAEWGNNLVPLAMALLAAFILFSFFTYYKEVKVLSSVVGGLLSVLAIGTIGMTYVVGHSGAESVWKEKYAQAKSPLKNELRLISLDEVKQHNSYSDCWTVVSDTVYDVTSFVNRHPAGSPAIKEMCGKNASEDFLGEHSGQKEPEKWLESLKIGTLQR
ncbi:MAG: cytochrome b5 domain-containing protein [Actinobacteria bacterium]|nr:cytochrome b5 domain-containing protein [Actinomycetota bacterium]